MSTAQDAAADTGRPATLAEAPPVPAGGQSPELFLSRLPAGPREWRCALIVVAVSALIFAAVAPAARQQLPALPAFLPLYQGALIACELMTAVVIAGQFAILRSAALLMLACAYLFSALMAVVHLAGFPGLFGPADLIGAGPQTTAWIYFIWHAAFPVLVMGYAILADRKVATDAPQQAAARLILTALGLTVAGALGLTLVTTAGHDLLPAIMDGNRDAPAKLPLAVATWALALAALVVLWRRRGLAVLDLWLGVVMIVWVIEIAFAAVLNGGRYDVGWYAGRVYGLLAGSVVLIMLLLENSRLYADLADARRREHLQAQRALAHHAERLRILNEIERAIVAEEEPESMMTRVIQPLPILLGARAVIAGFFDSGAGAVRWFAEASGGTVRAPALHDLSADAAAVRALRQGIPRIVDVHGTARHADVTITRAQRDEALELVPMVAAGELVGALALAGTAGGSRTQQMQIAQEVAALMAIAISQSRLRRSLQAACDELRQTQQAAMQQERLRAVGQMASGIAHDINNALSPVALYTDSLLETESSLSARARGGLEIIRRAVRDVTRTIARLRDFYRPRAQLLELVPLAVNPLVQEVIELTAARWRDMALARGAVVEVALELAPALPDITGVASEIRDALTNLVFNAVDAMPAGGTLTLRTKSGGVPDDGSGTVVVVEVADSGIGMDEDTRRRCLEPFFTTKGEDGTGLGLAMVFGMAQRHGCSLEIDSAPRAGTAVRLAFRAAATPGAGAAHERRAGAEPTLQGGGRS